MAQRSVGRHGIQGWRKECEARRGVVSTVHVTACRLLCARGVCRFRGTKLVWGISVGSRAQAISLRRCKSGDNGLGVQARRCRWCVRRP